MKHYADRDPMELDQAGGYYCRHVEAMTAEGLHAKSDIAGELGHRDRLVDDLERRLAIAQNALGVCQRERMKANMTALALRLEVEILRRHTPIEHLARADASLRQAQADGTNPKDPLGV